MKMREALAAGAGGSGRTLTTALPRARFASAVLKELERENGKLKRMLAEQLLEIDALKEVAKGNW